MLVELQPDTDYVLDGENVAAWYATFSASTAWRPTHTVATDVEELETFERIARVNDDASAR